MLTPLNYWKNDPPLSSDMIVPFIGVKSDRTQCYTKGENG